MEWYDGGFIQEGNKVVGNLESCGFKDIYNTSRDCETRVYIEDFLLDKEDAMEQIYELGS